MKLAEMEGEKVDNTERLKVIKKEEEVIKQEKKEKQEIAKQEQEKKVERLMVSYRCDFLVDGVGVRGGDNELVIEIHNNGHQYLPVNAIVLKVY